MGVLYDMCKHPESKPLDVITDLNEQGVPDEVRGEFEDARGDNA